MDMGRCGNGSWTLECPPLQSSNRMVGKAPLMLFVFTVKIAAELGDVLKPNLPMPRSESRENPECVQGFA